MDSSFQCPENNHFQCFACLGNVQEAENIAANKAKQELFWKTFKLEIKIYDELPLFLCVLCQNKLHIANDFLNQVTNSLQYLEEFRKSQVELISVKEETNIPTHQGSEFDHLENENKFDPCSSSDSDNEPLSKFAPQRKRKKRNLFNPKLERISLHLVQEAVDEYREKCKANANCILCEFKGLNIRNLSCHMVFKHKEKRSNWCLRCNLIVEDLESHKKTHNNRVWCKFCEKGVTRCHYLEHLKIHAGVEFSYEDCCKRFIPQKSLEDHKRQHKCERNFQCHICHKTFKLLKNLDDHILTHGRYQCDTCEKKFEIPELLSSHFCSGKPFKNRNNFPTKEDESGELDPLLLQALEEDFNLEDTTSEYDSKHDPRHFYTSDNMADIKMEDDSTLVKSEIESLTCHFCQRTYKTAYKLQKHIEAHMGIYSAKCKYCDKGFSSKADLTNHERVHTKEKPFICSSCGKGFVSGATLRIHMKQHTGKPEECELCKKRFCRKSELKLHLQKHRGERPFLCTDCGKSFAQKSHLTCHLTMHSEERPYSCILCEKSFKKKELLKHHMKLHGAKKFKCTVCFYECHKKYRLQQHMKMHEGKSGLKLFPCQLCSRNFSSGSLLNVHMGNAHNVVV